MLIDWFTVFAQAVNFLVLVWLLKRFLYRPVLKALDEREQHIADRLVAAARDQAAAQAERVAFEEKNTRFDRELEQRQRDLARDIAAERTRLLARARDESEALRATRLAQLETEFKTLQAEVARRTHAEAIAIARHALGELADAELEARMVTVFVQRLQVGELPPKTGPVTVQVQSAFALDAAQRARIEAPLQARYPAALTVSYALRPELLGGIELLIDGHKVAWSIGDRLATLAQQVETLLRAQQREAAG